MKVAEVSSVMENTEMVIETVKKVIFTHNCPFLKVVFPDPKIYLKKKILRCIINNTVDMKYNLKAELFTSHYQIYFISS